MVGNITQNIAFLFGIISQTAPPQRKLVDKGGGGVYIIITKRIGYFCVSFGGGFSLSININVSANIRQPAAAPHKKCLFIADHSRCLSMSLDSGGRRPLREKREGERGSQFINVCNQCAKARLLSRCAGNPAPLARTHHACFQSFWEVYTLEQIEKNPQFPLGRRHADVGDQRHGARLRGL